MFSLQSLRDLVSDRLTAAVEEIFGAIETTISSYEEEFDRRRKLLEVQMKLEDVPQQQEYNDTVLTDQRLCDQERLSGLDHVDPESLDIKEEVDDISISLEGKQLGATREADTLTLTVDNGENVQAETERGGDQQRLSQTSPVGESQDQTGSKDVENNFESKEDVDCKQESPDFNWQPDMKLHQIEVNIWGLTYTESSDIKEEVDEISIGLEGQQLVVKQEADTLIPTADNGESGQEEAERGGDRQLLSHSSPVGQSQDQTGSTDVEKDCEEDVDYKQGSPEFSWQPEIKLHRIEQPQLCASEKGDVLTDHLLSRQHKNQNHQKVGLSEDTLSPKGVTMVLTYEESEDMETETDREQQLLSPVDETPPTDSGSLSETQLMNPKKQSHHELNIGYNTPEGKRSEECEICRKTFSHRSRLEDHMRIHTGEKPFTCETCGKCFRMCSSLNRHVKTHTGEKPFVCETCGKGFAQRAHLGYHMRTHTDEKPFSCEICGKCFNVRSNRNHHMRIHTRERPFSCETCGKCFTKSSTVRRHMRTHTGEKPFTCKTCGKSFTQSATLTHHMKTHTDEKQFFCDTCDKRFSLASSLNRHKRTHTCERPFTCEICGTCFKHSATLTHHMKTHVDKKPFSCDTCGKCFSLAASRNRHARTHRGERPFTCETCGKCFTRNEHLDYHMRIHTAGDPMFLWKGTSLK